MVERFHKQGILTGNTEPDLNAPFKVYSFTNLVADHQKSVFRYVSPTWNWPWSLQQFKEACVKEAVKQLSH